MKNLCTFLLSVKPPNRLKFLHKELDFNIFFSSYTYMPANLMLLLGDLLAWDGWICIWGTFPPTPFFKMPLVGMTVTILDSILSLAWFRLKLTELLLLKSSILIPFLLQNVWFITVVLIFLVVSFAWSASWLVFVCEFPFKWR